LAQTFLYENVIDGMVQKQLHMFQKFQQLQFNICDIFFLLCSLKNLAD
jgi:hypothetical protein